MQSSLIHTVLKLNISFSIKGEEAQYIYNGDRLTEEIVHFALRVAHPPVRKFRKDDGLLNQLKRDKIIFFSYLGEPTGELWVSIFM